MLTVSSNSLLISLYLSNKTKYIIMNLRYIFNRHNPKGNLNLLNHTKKTTNMCDKSNMNSNTNNINKVETKTVTSLNTENLLYNPQITCKDSKNAVDQSTPNPLEALGINFNKKRKFVKLDIPDMNLDTVHKDARITLDFSNLINSTPNEFIETESKAIHDELESEEEIQIDGMEELDIDSISGDISLKEWTTNLTQSATNKLDNSYDDDINISTVENNLIGSTFNTKSKDT